MCFHVADDATLEEAPLLLNPPSQKYMLLPAPNTPNTECRMCVHGAE